MAVDAYFEKVALLLHGDGLHGSTTIVDSSPRPKTVTPYGNASISTVESGAFGGSSIRLDGTGDYLKIPDHSDFELDADLWTIECRFFESVSKPAATLISQMSTNVGVDVDAFYVQSVDGKIKVFLYTDGGLSAKQLTTVHTLNAWHHLAVVNDGMVGTIYLDGVSMGTFVVKGKLELSASELAIGAWLADGGAPINSYVTFNGYLEEVRITNGVARYTSAFTPPAIPHPNEGPPVLSAKCAAPMPGTAVVLRHDFSAALGDVISVYVMDLITPAGSVRVPISSWQATLRAGAASYVQCVVPACGAWLAAINVATEFVISRRAVLPSGAALEYEMARAPADQVRPDQGPQRFTCTLSGYAPGLAAVADPSTAYDRTLTGVRSVSGDASSGLRVRCAVDWLLRPGQRVWVNGMPFVVSYINYYSPSGYDSYMDVGQANG